MDNNIFSWSVRVDNIKQLRGGGTKKQLYNQCYSCYLCVTEGGGGGCKCTRVHDCMGITHLPFFPPLGVYDIRLIQKVLPGGASQTL